MSPEVTNKARDVPVILTSRLRLRGHEASDFDTLAALWSHPETVRFIGGQARSPHDVWITILRNRGLWQTLGYGYWLAEDRKTGAFVGEVGFADFHRDTTPTFWHVPECGWIISPNQQNFGFASEAVGAIHDWLDHDSDEGRSVCIIDEANAPSIRIAQKLGYRPAGTVRMRDEDVSFFERMTGSQNV